MNRRAFIKLLSVSVTAPLTVTSIVKSKTTKYNLHGVTTGRFSSKANIMDPDLARARQAEKTLNFAKNYGMGTKKMREHFELVTADYSEIEKQVAAYYLKRGSLRI